MRCSTFVAFALLATAAPTLAAPVATTTTNATTANSATASLTPEQSAALSLGTIGTIVGLGGSVISGIIDHFKNSGSQQQRRDALELEGLLARATDESGALALGDVSDLASIASNVVSVFHNLFGGSQSREFHEYLARADNDDSEALSLSGIAGIASIGGGIVDVLHSLFGSSTQQRREIAEIVARQLTDEQQSAALSLGTIGTIVGLGGSVISGIIDHFKDNGSQQQRRDALALRELLARADTSESGALSLSGVAGLASIGGGIADILHSLFGGSSQQRREIAEIVARQLTDEQSAALSLGTIGTIVGLGGSVISGIIDHFKDNGSQQQRRDALALEQLLTRADVDESGALDLSDLFKKIASPGGSSIFKSLLGSSGNQRRELLELLVRGSQARSLNGLD